MFYTRDVWYFSPNRGLNRPEVASLSDLNVGFKPPGYPL